MTDILSQAAAFGVTHVAIGVLTTDSPDKPMWFVEPNKDPSQAPQVSFDFLHADAVPIDKMTEVTIPMLFGVGNKFLAFRVKAFHLPRHLTPQQRQLLHLHIA